MSFYPILYASVLASVCAAAVWFLKWLFREHLPPSWHAAIWLVVFLRLIPGLPEWHTSISLWNNIDVERGVQTVQLAAGHAQYRADHGEEAPLPIVTDQIHNSRHYAAAPLKAVPDIGEILFFVWTIGAGGLFLWFLGSAFALKRRVRQYPPADKALCTRLEALQTHYPGIGRAEQSLPRVVHADSGTSPFVCGWMSPTLVIPAAMADSLDDRALLHELAHLGRGDLLKNWLLTLVRCTQWFNPVLWRVCDCVADDLELCCDETVLRALDDEDEQLGYGHVLLDLALARGGRRPGTSYIASGEKSMRRRVTQLARRKEISHRARGVGYLVFILTAAVCLTAPQHTASAFTTGIDTPKIFLRDQYGHRSDSSRTDWRELLKDAASFRAGDAAQAAALYGQAQALDNGYFAWLAADDDTRAHLEAQFAENERNSVLPWHFDDTITKNYFYHSAYPDEWINSYDVNAGFAVKNLCGAQGMYTAEIYYPFTKYRPEATSEDEDPDWHFRYYVDEISISVQDGRFAVTHTARYLVDLEELAYYDQILGHVPLAVYRAEDKQAVYEVRMHYAEVYSFPGFRGTESTWLQTEAAAQNNRFFGWMSSSNALELPNGIQNGYWFELWAKPKKPLSEFTIGQDDANVSYQNGYGLVSSGGGCGSGQWFWSLDFDDRWLDFSDLPRDADGYSALRSFVPYDTTNTIIAGLPEKLPFYIKAGGHHDSPIVIDHFDLVNYCGQEVSP